MVEPDNGASVTRLGPDLAISVVLPAHNATALLACTVEAIHPWFRPRAFSFEVLIVVEDHRRVYRVDD